MNKQDIIRKLTSRKFWLALIALVSGIVTVIWGEKTAEIVGGLLLQFGSVVAYAIGEGLVDAANKPPDEKDDGCGTCDLTPYLNEDGVDHE